MLAWSKSEESPANNSTAVNQDINLMADYIRKYKGSYSLSALKNYLISKGSSPEDVEKAVKLATEQK